MAHPSPPPPLHRYDAIGPVLAYWQDLRGPQSVPDRGDIVPTALEPHLGVSGILEHHASGEVRIRFAGQRFQSLLGAPVRGLALSSFFAQGDRAHLAILLQQMFETQQVLTMSLAQSGSAPAARLAVMPLTGPQGRVDRALMVLDHGGPRVTTAPFRILSAHLAEGSAASAHANMPRKRPVLRVIQGGLG